MIDHATGTGTGTGTGEHRGGPTRQRLQIFGRGNPPDDTNRGRMPDGHQLLPIGEIARRSGFAPSALRHYETLGLIASHRTGADRRVYERGVLRRLAVIRAGQRVGLSLDEIRDSFGSLDPHHGPSRREWARISWRWQPLLDARIRELEAVRDNLANCVGCGCLSMRQCSLYNPGDVLGADGEVGAQRHFPTDT